MSQTDKLYRLQEMCSDDFFTRNLSPDKRDVALLCFNIGQRSSLESLIARSGAAYRRTLGHRVPLRLLVGCQADMVIYL